jgi:hypothetical protein
MQAVNIILFEEITDILMVDQRRKIHLIVLASSTPRQKEAGDKKAAFAQFCKKALGNHFVSVLRGREFQSRSRLKFIKSCDDANINGSMMFDDGHHMSAMSSFRILSF